MSDRTRRALQQVQNILEDELYYLRDDVDDLMADEIEQLLADVRFVLSKVKR